MGNFTESKSIVPLTFNLEETTPVLHKEQQLQWHGGDNVIGFQNDVR